MTLYARPAQMQAPFCHSEAVAHVNPFTPDGKSRVSLYLGEEAEPLLASKYPGAGSQGRGADDEPDRVHRKRTQ